MTFDEVTVLADAEMTEHGFRVIENPWARGTVPPGAMARFYTRIDDTPPDKRGYPVVAVGVLESEMKSAPLVELVKTRAKNARREYDQKVQKRSNGD